MTDRRYTPIIANYNKKIAYPMFDSEKKGC